MDKKELWTALSALTVAVGGADYALAEQRAGVTGQLNPAVEGQLHNDKSRVLFVGSDVFRNEVIRTDAEGQAHLMFLDQSSLTVGPNSVVVIDRFVYDPDKQTGELTLSATKGVLRFVGGALSKKGKVKFNTPVGTLGARGAVALIESQGADGDTTICLMFGEEASGTSNISGNSLATAEQEHCLTFSPDGSVKEYSIDPQKLEEMLLAFLGPDHPNPPDVQDLAYPTNLADWMEQLNELDILDDAVFDEQYATDAQNMAIDDQQS